MKKEDLFSKWLDHDLTENELKAFEQLDAFGSLDRLDRAAKGIAVPKLDTEESLKRLLAKPEMKRTQKKVRTLPLKRLAASIAALLVIAFSLYTVLRQTPQLEHVAMNGEAIELSLHDNSQVVLNAGSSLRYSGENWSESREIELEGEAYFDVESGSTFTVKTSGGNVTVRGTRFNVKDRGDWFEVSCFEGEVAVSYGSKEYLLKAGRSFNLISGVISLSDTEELVPSWVEHKSVFRSVPYSQVLDELGRQYDLEIQLEGMDKNLIFTGSFTHDDLETALKAISIPLSLTYEVSERVVTLKK